MKNGRVSVICRDSVWRIFWNRKFDILPDLRDIPGRLKVAVLRRRLNNGEWHVEEKITAIYGVDRESW